jgi:hypothetical protein
LPRVDAARLELDRIGPREHDPGHEVGNDADAAEKGGHDEPEPYEERLDSVRLGDSAGDAGDDAVLAAPAQLPVSGWCGRRVHSRHHPRGSRRVPSGMTLVDPRVTPEVAPGATPS